MKSKFFMLSLAGASLAMALTSCNSNPEAKVEHAQEEVAEAKQDLKEAKQEANQDQAKDDADFVAEMEAKIDANDQKIDELKSNISKQTPAKKELYKTRIQELKDRNDVLRKKIQDYKAEERKENREEFKREYRHDMDELDKALGDIGKDNVK